MKIFIGWDSKEEIAYEVCKFSILKHASIPVEIIPLKQTELREKSLYWREQDIGSTEFTLTRFLTPYLSHYVGVSLFVDCDFLFERDIKELLDCYDENKAVQVVKHEYIPKETTKFLNNVQHVYPRKNWSSLMLFNCEHPSNRIIDTQLVNNMEPSYLHRFQWLEDELIGNISHEWNWLEGHYKEPEDGSPKAIHYTRGGPWFEGYEEVDYAERWKQALEEYKRSQ